ncbi:PPE family protein [Mycobacterium sp.]|uniref:PPE family protein n=1 Tax=Mycobacterium sp. TaxID=1785 RepID=UPI003D6B540D
MDFGVFPPEVNSGRMYAGPGPESMVAAAAAWDGLTAELHSAATAYGSVITGLTGESWQGPSSAAMAAAAAPYAQWLSATAAQAEQSATQARSAAAAYETAFASMVPPPVIAANRTQLASLVATNIFGQNTAAIAATEAQYGEMWAQDAAAMYGYAGQSAAASRMTPFASAPQVTNPGGPAAQAAAIGQVSGTAASTHAQTALSQVMSAVPQTVQSLASPAAVDPPAALPSFSQISAYIQTIPKLILPANDVLITVIYGLVQAVRGVQSGVLPAGAGLLEAGLGSTTHVAGVAGGLGPAASAGMARAGLVGALSVPPSWAAATPTIRLAASVLQGSGLGAAPAVVADGAGSLFSQMALAGMAGSALGGAAPRAVSGAVGRVGRPIAGKDNQTPDKDDQTPDKLKRVLAEMSQKPESVQHWHTGQEQLESLLARLSKTPGVHAVHVSKKAKPEPPKSQSL